MGSIAPPAEGTQFAWVVGISKRNDTMTAAPSVIVI